MDLLRRAKVQCVVEGETSIYTTLKREWKFVIMIFRETAPYVH